MCMRLIIACIFDIVCACVGVGVIVRERERERECECVCVCVCVSERERLDIHIIRKITKKQRYIRGNITSLQVSRLMKTNIRIHSTTGYICLLEV